MEATVYAQTQPGNTDELVIEYLPLVKKIGLHLIAKLPPSVELDDLLQVGVIGLIQSGSTYDASRGASCRARVLCDGERRVRQHGFRR